MLTPQRASDIPSHLADLPERRKLLENYKLWDLEKFVQAQTEVTLRYPHLPHNQK